MAIQAIIFVLGVWLFQQMSFIPSGFWLLAIPALVFVVYRFTFPRRFVSYFLALVLGFAWAGLFASWRLADALPPEWETKELELVGVVATLPQTIENGTRFTFDVERVLTPNAKVPRHVSLAQYVDGFSNTANTSNLLKFHAGERWHLRVKLKRPHATMNPHGFDFSELGYELNDIQAGPLPDGFWAAIFGNGYESKSCKAQLFIVNIETGALIKVIDTGAGS